jgi:hypothetical protein
MRYLLRYIADLWNGWIGSMSSTASIVFLIVGFIWNLTVGGQLRYWLWASFVCYVIASFRLWFRLRPVLRLEIKNLLFESDWSKSRALEDGVKFFDVALDLDVINTHITDNALRVAELIVCADKRKGVKHRARIEFSHNTSILKQGYPTRVHIDFRFPDHSPDLSLNIRGWKYVLRIVDVYDVEHTVNGRLPDRLSNESKGEMRSAVAAFNR